MSEVTTKTIIGRVGTDPEISTTPTGKALAKFRLAQTVWDREAREEATVWYDVSAFEKDAEIAQENVRKGERIYVTGRASVYKGTTGDRQQITVNEMGLADRFRPTGAGEW